LSVLNSKLKSTIVASLQDKVKFYCDEVLKVYDAQLDANGNPTWKRAESKSDLARNINWTVKFQVLGITYSKIAKAAGLDVSTVKREVDSTLTLIGLPRRADAKPGRPAGSKDSPVSWRQSTKQILK